LKEDAPDAVTDDTAKKGAKPEDRLVEHLEPKKAQHHPNNQGEPSRIKKMAVYLVQEDDNVCEKRIHEVSLTCPR
jgi:hypothetical protein